MTEPLDTSTSNRIAVLRFALIVGIVILHTPPYVPLSETPDDLFGFVKAFFSHGLFRATVPVLTCISGYLLFRSSLDTQFASLVKKKVKSLLIPMLLWNLPLVVALYLIQANGILGHSFSAQLYPFDAFTFLDKTFGLLTVPVNFPLNFLRDLFVLCLLAPVFGVMLRHTPWAGLIAVTVIFWFNIDSYLILRPTMPINFYMGGLVAVMSWRMTKLDTFAWASLAALIVCCALIVILEIEDRRWFRVVSPVLVWSASVFIVDTALGRLFKKLSPAAFLIFLAHGPLLLLFWILYQRIQTAVPYEVFWLSTPFVVVLLCLSTRAFFLKYFPALYGLFVGRN